MALGKASNFNAARPDYDRLRTTLNDTKFQQSNNAAYQTIFGLIDASQRFQNIVNNQFEAIFGLLGRIRELPSNVLLGRGSGGTGPAQLITVDDTLEFRNTVLSVKQPGDWDLNLLKLNSQDVADSSTLTNDDILVFPMNEFDIYYVQLLLLYAGNDTTGDYKFNFGLPNVTGWYRYIVQTDAGGALQVSTGIQLAAVNNLAADIVCGTDAAMTPRMAWLDMMIRAGSNGNVQFKFALNSAAIARTARTYAGSILRAQLLSGIPIGQVDGIGGGGANAGSGPGQGSDPPTVPLPNLLGVVEDYNTSNPTQIFEAEINHDFLNGVVAALQAIDTRFGFNGKRGNVSDPSNDAISYYHGSGSVPPADGDKNVYVIDIIAALGTPGATPAWINVTTPAAAGAYILGPI